MHEIAKRGYYFPLFYANEFINYCSVIIKGILHLLD